MFTEFLPISRQEMLEKGIDRPDFVVVGGDAYVDHPWFGCGFIGFIFVYF